MPQPCASGDATPRPGTSAVVFLAGEALADAIAAFTGIPAWAALATYALGQSFTTSDLCHNGPPTLVWPTAVQIAELIAGDPFADSAAEIAFGTVIENAVFHLLCTCTDNTQPAPPTIQPYPTGATQVGSPYIPTPSQGPCATTASTFTFPAGSTVVPHDWSPSLATGLLTQTVADTFGLGYTTGFIIPTGITRIGFTWMANTGYPASVNDIGFYNAAGAFVSSGSFSIADWSSVSTPDNETNVQWHTVPSGAVAFNVVGESYGTRGGGTTQTVDQTVALTMYLNCADNLNTPVTPCCPPDQNLAGQIQLILNALSAIYAGLPTQPHSYADGTVHSGITGNGTLAIGATTLAVKVTTVTLPAVYGEEVGSPNRYFDLGYITFESDAAPYANQRLEFTSQIFTAPQLATTVHHTFPPGMIATITEVTAGP